jgi:hypothetical protein
MPYRIVAAVAVLYAALAAASVPVGTRSARVTIDIRNGGNADGYVDCIGFTIGPVGANMVTNPGAEAGETTGWTVRSGGGLYRFHWNGFDGYPFIGTSDACAARGAWGWFGKGAPTLVDQSVDLTPWAAQIDTGTVPWVLSAWIGGYASDPDNARIHLEFFNSSMVSLGLHTIGPVSPADRDNQTKLLFRIAGDYGSGNTATEFVPIRARAAAVEIWITPFWGCSGDGYADSLWFSLNDGNNLLRDADAEQPLTGAWVHEAWSGVPRLGRLLYGTYVAATCAKGEYHFLGTEACNPGPLGAYQYVDISARAAEIDTGAQRWTLAGYLGGWQDDADSVKVTVDFLTAAPDGVVLARGSIGPVTNTDRGNQTMLLYRTQTPTPDGGAHPGICPSQHRLGAQQQGCCYTSAH